MLITTLVVSFCKDGGVRVSVHPNSPPRRQANSEQYTGELNPLLQTAINPQPPHATWKDQLCFSLLPGHYSSLTAPKLQPTANQVMCNFRFITLINTNNTLNYQSTNETHCTLHTTHYKLHTTNNTLNTTHNTLHTKHYTQHTTHYTLQTTH